MFAVQARHAGRQTMTQWLIGMLATSSFLNDCDTVINTAPQANQVSTITIDTVTNSATYTVTINSIDVSYTADASAVNTEIVAGLIAAIEDDPAVSASVTCVATSATVITLTARLPGIAFTITDADAKITTATSTAAADANAVPFGRLILLEDVDVDTGNVEGSLAMSSRMTAQVDSWAITYESTIALNVQIIVDGVAYTVSHTMATDRDTSIDALVVKINGVAMGLPAATVIASADAGAATALVLTSEVAGKAFVSRVWLGVGATVAAPALTQTAPVDSDITRAQVGISVFAYDEESTAAGVSTPSYPANASMKVLRKGDIAVECAEAVTFGAPVYVELGVTADNGQFFAASSATRVLLPAAKWIRNEQSAADDNVAILRLG